MRAILVLTLVVAVTNARPDVSSGYPEHAPQDHYVGVTPDHSASGVSLNGQDHVATNGPAASFGVSGSGGAISFDSNGSAGSSGTASFGAGGGAAGLSAQGSGAGGASQQFSAVSAGGNTGGFQAQQDYSSSSGGVAAFPVLQQQQSVASRFGAGSSGQQYGSSSVKSSGSSFGVSQGSNFNGQQSGTYQQGGNAAAAAAAYSDVQQLEPIITKNFYFEAAPEEPEETRGPKFVPIGRPQKNYKIIFIKTPSFGLNSQVIPIIPANEEKTIVYVLSKKPEFNQDIELPSAPVTEATKPEVFFIKYKSEQDAIDAQTQIQGAYKQSNNIESDSNISEIQNAFINAGNAASSGSESLGGYRSGNIGSVGGVSSGSSVGISSGLSSSNLGSSVGFSSGNGGSSAGFSAGNSGNSGGFSAGNSVNSAAYSSGNPLNSVGIQADSSAAYSSGSTGGFSIDSSSGSSYGSLPGIPGQVNIEIGSDHGGASNGAHQNAAHGGSASGGSDYVHSASNDDAVSVNFVDTSSAAGAEANYLPSSGAEHQN